MRAQLERELVNVVLPYCPDADLEEIKMKITMVVGNYEVQSRSTELIPYEEDATQTAIRNFLAAKLAAGMSARTIQYYSQSVRAAINAIAKPFDQIKPDDIRLYLAVRVQKDGVSKVTANNERRCLSAFYGWLQREEILLKNPMAKVDAIKVNKKKKKAFSPLEVERMRNACRSSRETALIETLLSTWCRVTEISLIKISEIYEAKLVVHGKGNKEREVYLNAKAQVALDTYLNDRTDGNPWLFPRAKYAGRMQSYQKSGIPKERMCEWYTNPDLVDPSRHMDVGSIESIIRDLGRRANVENAHPHRFRRTGATLALRQGMPLTVVSKMLGHESIATTQIYLDISDEEMEQAHKKYVI